MSRQIQLRRGTSTEHEIFTGAPGEVTVDTTANTLRVHDGQTPGGTAMARADSVMDMTGTDYVVAWQSPTADNNYTWYRLYKSGWVEQGGPLTFPVAGTSITTKTINFPIEMANTNYTAQPTPIWAQPDKYYGWALQSKTTTSMTYHGYNTTKTDCASWFVCGMSAE